MKLNPQEVDLFYNLMWSLQFFVNHNRQIIPKVKTITHYARLSIEEKYKIRDELYRNIEEILPHYLRENPQSLSQEMLNIVMQWQHYVTGTFYRERTLKKHAVFISQEDSKVYAVWGISNDFTDMFSSHRMPAMIRTVLLPFRGKIIYDGLYHLYKKPANYLSPEIIDYLKQIYLSAKQRGELIESLEISERTPPLVLSPGGNEKDKANHLGPSWEESLCQIETLTNQLGNFQQKRRECQLCTPAIAMIDSCVGFARALATNPDDTEFLYKKLKKIEKILINIVHVMNNDPPNQPMDSF